MLRLLIFSFIAGICLGEAFFFGQHQTLVDSAPSGWFREKNTIPYKLSALQGNSKAEVGEWGLDFYRGIYPQSSYNRLEVKARIPTSGQLEAWLSAPPKGVFACRGHNCGQQIGVGLIIERIGEPSIKLVERKYIRNKWRERVLSCSFSPPKEEDISLKLAYTNRSLEVSFGEERCSVQTQKGSSVPLLRPGIRKIYLQEIKVNGTALPSSPPFPRFLCWLMGGLFSSLLMLLDMRIRIRQLGTIAAGLALAMGSLLIFGNLKGWLESMRAAWIPWRWLPFIVGIGSMGFIRATLYSFRLLPTIPTGKWSLVLPLISALLVQLSPTLHGEYERALAFFIVLCVPYILTFFTKTMQPLRDKVSLLLGFWGLLAMIVIVSTRPVHIWGAVWFYGTGLLYALLIWANCYAKRLRFYNTICLVSCILIIIAVEGTLRGSKAGRQWSNQGSQTELNDVFGWVSTANEDFALLETGTHTSYPSKGYPVAFSAQKQKKRIISFGGSTTGGAFQNDNINDFYPSKLESLLDDKWEVLNQGVGGWTSWHIKEYIQRQKDNLNPDIVTLYIGHNDLLTFTPLPYKDLYKAWKSNPSAKSMSTFLGAFRMYHAMRHFLVSLRPVQKKVAVPTADARDNIKNIIDSFSPNVQIYLLSEGLAPDPSPLQQYNEMMEALAQEYDNVYYRDIALELHSHPSSEVYLDDCHLTEFGHRTVAQSILEELIQTQSVEKK